MIVRELITKLGFKTDEGQLKRYEQRVDGFRVKMSAIATAIGGYFTGALIKDIAETGMRVQGITNALETITGSAQKGAEEFQWLREETKRLGVETLGAADAYSKFLAAGIGRPIQAQARNIFSAVTEASAALQLKPEDTNGILWTLSQMVSKGKVMAEELTGQLGERLPGALSIAADSMNMKMDVFMQAMQKGIKTEDFLPKFAEELRKRFADGVEKGANSARAQLNRFLNSWVFLKAKIAESGLLDAMTSVLPVLEDYIDKMRDWLEANRDIIRQNLTGTLKGIIEALKIAAYLVGAAVSAFTAFADAVGGADHAIRLLAGAFAAVKLGQFLTVLTGVVAAIRAMGVAVALVNAAWFAGIGAIIAAFALLVDDITTWVNGGDSLLGKLLGPWIEFKAGFNAILRSISNSILDFYDDVVAIFDKICQKAAAIANGFKNGFQGASSFFGRMLEAMPDAPAGTAGIGYSASDVALSTIRPATGSKPSTVNNNATANVNVTVPAGTSKEQADYITKQVKDAVISTQMDLMRSAAKNFTMVE